MNLKIYHLFRHGLVLGMLGLLLALGSGAGAQIAWYGSVHYDNGAAPSISVSGNNVVEVHQDFTGGLWCRRGTLNWLPWVGSFITWSVDFPYDAGWAPKISLSGNNFVEVHEDFTGGLHYHTGNLTANSIGFNDSTPYENGVAPSVCLNGSEIVEVHNDFSGGLWYRRGFLNGRSISWSNGGNSSWYDNGSYPSVSISNGNVVETHEDFSGGLYSHTGYLWSWYINGYFYNWILWNNSVHYENGYAPSISMNGTKVVEVHNGTVGDLWYRTGTFGGYDIQWNNGGHSTQYDYGSYPSISYNGYNVVEAHQDFSGGLYSQLGIF
ncbi:MAG TPA: hypothetical protein VKU00_09230 [Chthonomonadaceae bacterium]|nr:hypothetical protein [Chthonomonadaceae bacterium]